jgi:hypothetical protein
LAKNGYGAVGDGSFLFRIGFLVAGAEFLGILDYLMKKQIKF